MTPAIHMMNHSFPVFAGSQGDTAAAE